MLFLFFPPTIAENKERRKVKNTKDYTNIGSNLKGELDTISKTLKIVGTGEMMNWQDYSLVPWYVDWRDIEIIEIGNGVKNIGNHSFHLCSLVTKVIMPDDSSSALLMIGEDAFNNCEELLSITIPSTVTTIQKEAFYHCPKLASVTMPNEGLSALSIIGVSAFSETGLLLISIPSSVKSIGNDAFYYCTLLQKIDVGPNSKHYSSDQGILFDFAKTVLIQSGCAQNGEVRIPSSVEIIRSSSFCYCAKITNVIIPNDSNLREIGSFAFCECLLLLSIKLPSSLTTLGKGAFDWCTNLATVKFCGLENPPNCGIDIFSRIIMIQVPENYKGDKFAEAEVKKILSISECPIPKKNTVIYQQQLNPKKFLLLIISGIFFN